MNDLVYLLPNTKEPYTTSEVIAAYAEIKHHAIQQLVQKHEGDFQAFGIIAFEMRKTGGRGRPETIYHLNEQQATLLMTYLRNTPVVREFKKELVRQFFAMREELRAVKAIKAERKIIRPEMTDAIKALPDSPHKQFKYSQYTDLAYRAALGKSARQLRLERGADKKAVASDYMTAGELAAVVGMENRIAVLLEIGMDYHQIRASLTRVQLIPQAGRNTG